MGEPVTLHKYLYANGDPANGIDPSGNVTLGSAMSGVSGFASLSIRATIGYTSVISRTFVGAAAQGGILAIRNEIKRCVRTQLSGSKKKKCRIDVPIVVAGNDFPNQRQHIADAQLGRGNQLGGRFITPVLRYQRSDINRKSWPQKTLGGKRSTSPNGLMGCGKSDFHFAAKKFASPRLDCDEYPFSASMEGGFKNYRRHRVSGRFIPSSENRTFGLSVIGQISRLKRGQRYIVAPLKWSPASFVINKP